MFFVFKNLNQKNKKAYLLTWNQNFSKKFLFFVFLVFSRFRKNHYVEREEFY